MIPTPLLIAKKRDHKELSDEEIQQFITGAVDKSISGEQIGAMLMAIFLNGMNKREIVRLTHCMRFSGDQLKWEKYPGLVCDKHSTGGVGDKISIPLAPALAACGVKVPMISGRGLGHTGGTLDKLESIPGYTVIQTNDTMDQLLDKVGCFIVGQSPNLVPADRLIYSIRDVTGTVESIPLITGSIISKKASAGLNALLLDVKVGRAAFMKTEESARALAQSLVDAGNGNGVKTCALLTRMEAPLGNMIGNSLEIIESIYCMQGKSPSDLEELICEQGGNLLFLTGRAASAKEGYQKIHASLNDGTALQKFKEMIIGQGVDPQKAETLLADPYAVLGKAAHVTEVLAEQDGYVAEIDSMVLALLASRYGAGRAKASDLIDFVVGIEIKAHLGAAVKKGSVIAVFHSSRPAPENDIAELRSAFTFSENAVPKTSLIIGSIGF